MIYHLSQSMALLLVEKQVKWKQSICPFDFSFFFSVVFCALSSVAIIHYLKTWEQWTKLMCKVQVHTIYRADRVNSGECEVRIPRIPLLSLPIWYMFLWLYVYEYQNCMLVAYNFVINVFSTDHTFFPLKEIHLRIRGRRTENNYTL